MHSRPTGSRQLALLHPCLERKAPCSPERLPAAEKENSAAVPGRGLSTQNPRINGDPGRSHQTSEFGHKGPGLREALEGGGGTQDGPRGIPGPRHPLGWPRGEAKGPLAGLLVKQPESQPRSHRLAGWWVPSCHRIRGGRAGLPMASFLGVPTRTAPVPSYPHTCTCSHVYLTQAHVCVRVCTHMHTFCMCTSWQSPSRTAWFPPCSLPRRQPPGPQDTVGGPSISLTKASE